MHTEKASEQQVAAFYDTVYAAGGVNAMRTLAHYREVFDHLQPIRPGGKSLDIGCGTGFFLKVASDAGLEAYGLDVSPKAVALCKEVAPKAQVVVGRGEELPFTDNFFDYIIFGGTLEHFLDPDKGLEEAVRVARDDAKFLIIVPNRNYWLWRVRGVYGTNQSQIQELLLDYNGWASLFRKHDLEPVTAHQDPWPWQSVKIFKFKNPWRIVRRVFYRFIWLFIPLRQTYQFVFVAQKNKKP